jgi:hypothetical protein
VRDVFISYARADKPKAELIAQALGRDGLSVWWDPYIPPGKTYSEVIGQALKSAKCIIVLWSKQSVASDWVRDEAEVGRRRRILVPVNIEDVERPLGFGQFQTANLIGWKGDSAHSELVKLLDAVSAQVGLRRSPAEPVPKAPQQASGKIQICYRRKDSSAWAGRLCDRLIARFGRNNIFMDYDSFPLGVDFVKAIRERVESCDVLISVIDKRWLTTFHEKRRRRIDDFLLIEMMTALKRGVPVIPVLVDGASMPRERDLPDDLKALVRRNALEVRHDSFGGDSERLIAAVERALEETR